jgi:predicted acylesterase/phospholipase RssA/CRP-like cAMP-binding protein
MTEVPGEVEGSLGNDPRRSDTSLLAELAPDTREAVTETSTRVFVRAGDPVFRQGDVADAMYIVESGRVEVVDEADGPPGVVLRSLGPGSSIGEIALLTGSRRSASVRARRDSVLLRLDVAGFEALLRGRPELTLALTRATSRWLTRTGEPRSQRSYPAVVVLTSLVPERGLRMLGQDVVRAVESLVGHGRAVFITGARARAEAIGFGPTGVASDAEVTAALGMALDRWERDHDVVVLSTDDADTGDPDTRLWVEFCLRSADRVVVVIGPEDTPARFQAASERIRSHLPTPPDLCFMGFRDTSLVTRWLELLPCTAHHHVDTDTARDVEETVGRLVRRLMGRSVGVVLSGGGARGFAHLGVLDAFAAAGVTVDRVGGCSIGAITGALHAGGHSTESAVETCRRFFVRSNPLNDYVLPRTALLRGNKLRSSLQAAFGEESIEGLPRAYYCVSADLVSARTVVHERGSLWRALLASVSIPGLLPPVPADDRLLVDGGVLNNLPIDVMADAHEGPVVAVDVMRPFTGQARGAVDRETGRRLPVIAEILSRVAVLGSWRAVEWNRPRAALTITLSDDGTGMLDWPRLDTLVEAGRRAGEAALEGGVCDALRAGVDPPPASEDRGRPSAVASHAVRARADESSRRA